ncbi:hypothetical protein EG68_08923 [Paragonimus skrjabini miyazakii]|uniref:Tubulin-specific chaperone A n=1 Tax=Paragonimus skrjabini miyazakii TaxID=59628 RepID=A0A8S9YMU9_9TREM|nr:hypothetical protein EG68_08923 [Paragonimus skrjabini miyazakii]
MLVKMSSAAIISVVPHCRSHSDFGICQLKTTVMADPRLRKLTIGCNVVKRIGKEKSKYAEEVVKQTKFYEDKVAAGAEECEIKMAKALLDESKMMIPDCQIRLEKALCDLNNLLQECDHELNETKEFVDAQSIYAQYAEGVR